MHTRREISFLLLEEVFDKPKARNLSPSLLLKFEKGFFLQILFGIWISAFSNVKSAKLNLCLLLNCHTKNYVDKQNSKFESSTILSKTTQLSSVYIFILFGYNWWQYDRMDKIEQYLCRGKRFAEGVGSSL